MINCSRHSFYYCQMLAISEFMNLRTIDVPVRIGYAESDCGGSKAWVLRAMLWESGWACHRSIGGARRMSGRKSRLSETAATSEGMHERPQVWENWRCAVTVRTYRGWGPRKEDGVSLAPESARPKENPVPVIV